MSTPPTDAGRASDRVAEIRQRLEAATPGPWTAASQNRRKDGVAVVIAEQPDDSAPVAVLAGARFTIKRRHANAALTAAAPDDIAWLLSRLAVVEAERDELRATVAKVERLIEAQGDDSYVMSHALRRALSGTTEGPS